MKGSGSHRWGPVTRVVEGEYAVVSKLEAPLMAI